MREYHGTAALNVAADPDTVFDLITDVDRLPEWNAAIESIAERPASLTTGAEWVVVMHPPKLPRWTSRSRVLELDRATRHFAYRTQTDDGNPTYVDWVWSVVADGDSTQVVVSWDAHILTFARRIIAPLIRRPGLRREVPASLARIDAAIQHPRATPPARAGRNDGSTR